VAALLIHHLRQPYFSSHPNMTVGKALSRDYNVAYVLNKVQPRCGSSLTLCIDVLL